MASGIIQFPAALAAAHDSLLPKNRNQKTTDSGGSARIIDQHKGLYLKVILYAKVRMLVKFFFSQEQRNRADSRMNRACARMGSSMEIDWRYHVSYSD